MKIVLIEVMESKLQIWLAFVSSILWPVVVFTVLWFLRKELRLLIKRIAKVKYGDTEIAFQAEAKDALAVSGQAAAQVDLVDPEGFFTEKGVASLIEKSGIAPNDRIAGSLLLFRTKNQRTWLVATTKELFCVLDDENTRTTKRLIQWHLLLERAQPVVARSSKFKARTGTVDIGPREGWLYSYALFPKPHLVQEAIEALVAKAK